MSLQQQESDGMGRTPNLPCCVHCGCFDSSVGACAECQETMICSSCGTDLERELAVCGQACVEAAVLRIKEKNRKLIAENKHLVQACERVREFSESRRRSDEDYARDLGRCAGAVLHGLASSGAK